jgi:CrcB protein
MSRDNAALPWWRGAGDSIGLYGLVALGAAIGGVGRMLVSLALAGPGFPWGTLVANVVGSFVIGFFATLSEPGGRLMASAGVRQFVIAGLCGGFTTFSVFSLESVRFLAAGHYLTAASYVGVSVVTWLIAVWLGFVIATRLNGISGLGALKRELENSDGDGHT